MVNDDLKKYISITGTGDNTSDKEHPSDDNVDVCDDVLLFFSFDIVNSSLYKTINYYGWSIVIGNILTKIRNNVSSKIKNAEVWRVFGDEIVFIVEVCDRDSIYEYIEAIYDILTYYCDEIDRGTLFEEIDELDGIATQLVKLQDVISLQASSWIAVVTDRENIKKQSHSKYVENVFEIYETNPDNKFYEFMGIDIDTGFRLSKETRARRLIVSFELAYLLMEREEYKEKLNIVTYRVLKGVWNNTVYPIIWYYDAAKNPDNKDMTFEESMPFDAVDQDKIYDEFFVDIKEKKYADYMYTDVKRALEKICNDRKLTNKINTIETLLKNTSRNRRFIKNTKLELHCAAVCFNENGELLIVQRCVKDFLPGKWEFGCAKANYTIDLVEIIQNEYKQDFGIEIKLMLDENRSDKQPIPLAVYTIKRKEELHKGIIFIADIIGGEVDLTESKKHENYRFVKESDISILEKEDMQFVPDALDTMRKAFDLRRKIKESH